MMKKIKTILLSSVMIPYGASNFYINDTVVSMVSSSGATKPSDSVEVIVDNLDKFQGMYNETYPDKIPFHASSVENVMDILILDDWKEMDGYLVDFNDDCGYVVVGYDYVLYDIQTTGENPYKNVSESVTRLFACSTGYQYFYNGLYSVDDKNNSEETEWENIELSNNRGDEKKGCGKIENPDQYVSDVYGKGYKIAKEKSLSMKGFTQYKLSAYHHYENGFPYSESNCWMVSAYHVLQYYTDSIYQDQMPGSDKEIIYNPRVEEPHIYVKYFDSTGKCRELTEVDGEKKDKWYLTNYDFPELFASVRKMADEKYGKCDGGTTGQTANLIKWVGQKYGATFKTNCVYRWGYYADAVAKNIENNIPSIWSTSNDTYGSHSMAVNGYKYYQKTTKFWIFTSVKTKLFYELRDGHTSEPRFYDISGHVGFSCITFVYPK